MPISTYGAAISLRPVKPASIIAQVEGWGTGTWKGTMAISPSPCFTPRQRSAWLRAILSGRLSRRTADCGGGAAAGAGAG